MDIQPSTEIAPPTTTRKVWVVSNLRVPEGGNPSEYIYEENFKGEMIRIPPNGEKRIIMPWITAVKFLGRASKAPQDPFPDGGFVNPETGQVESHRFGKPLKIVEFTEDEAKRYHGMSAKDAEKAHLEHSKALSEARHTTENQDVMSADGEKPQELPKRRGRPPKVQVEEYFTS